MKVEKMSDKLNRYKEDAIEAFNNNIVTLEDYSDIIVEEIKPTYDMVLNLNRFLLEQLKEINGTNKDLKKKVKKSLADTTEFIKLIEELDTISY